MIKEAYQLGVKLALQQAGLLKLQEGELPSGAMVKQADPVDRTGYLFRNQQPTKTAIGSPNVILDTSLDAWVRKLLDK